MLQRLATILVVGAALLLLTEQFGPGGIQRRAAGELREFRGRVEPAVTADPRFAQVLIRSSSHPALVVTGTVADNAARRELEVIVRPPVGAGFGFNFQVAVAPAAQPAPCTTSSGRGVASEVAMTTDDAVAAYSAMPPERQLRVLADYAHDLTVVARETYVVGTDDVEDPPRLRALNEVLHRVTGHMRHLLAGNTKRYPDDVIVPAVVAGGDPRLLEAFARVLLRWN